MTVKYAPLAVLLLIPAVILIPYAEIGGDEADGEDNLRVYFQSQGVNVLMSVDGEECTELTDSPAGLRGFEIPSGSKATVTLSSDRYVMSGLKIIPYVPLYDGGKGESVPLDIKTVYESEDGHTATAEIDFSTLGSEKSVQLWLVSEELFPEPGPTSAETAVNLWPIYVPVAGLISAIVFLFVAIRLFGFGKESPEAEE